MTKHITDYKTGEKITVCKECHVRIHTQENHDLNPEGVITKYREQNKGKKPIQLKIRGSEEGRARWKGLSNKYNLTYNELVIALTELAKRDKEQFNNIIEEMREITYTAPTRKTTR